ncbi:single-stranded DNA-binding protein [Pseudonocardia adelaidensis]|uniref:Single-stranded DNA-binding protein n=1 Tax=Pseudonocardia adelaidensis TaxID=648754 RepID=A0ABP9NWD6_9PSEU
MSTIYLTVPGRIATKPERLSSAKGGTGAKFRVATTERWFDRAADSWNDAQPVYLTVTCWRQLAESVLRSLRIGDPVIVHGKLINSSFERDGRVERRLEISAAAVGPDLRWCTAAVTRTRGAAAEAPEGASADVDGAPSSGSGPAASPAVEPGEWPVAGEAGFARSGRDARVGVLAGEGAVGP